MDINKCNIYFGNLKIKTGYFGQYKFYEDSAKRELTLLSFGTGIANISYVAPAYINITVGRGITFQSFGTGTVDLTYVAPVNVNITDSNTLSLMSFGTSIVNIS